MGVALENRARDVICCDPVSQNADSSELSKKRENVNEKNFVFVLVEIEFCYISVRLLFHHKSNKKLLHPTPASIKKYDRNIFKRSEITKEFIRHIYKAKGNLSYRNNVKWLF